MSFVPPLIAEQDLEVAPEGLYLLADENGREPVIRRDFEAFDMQTGALQKMDLVLACRVRSPLPIQMPFKGADSVVVRRDGLVIVKQWIADPRWS